MGGLSGHQGYTPLTGGFGPKWLFILLPALACFVVYLALHRRLVLWTFVVPFVVMLAATPSTGSRGFRSRSSRSARSRCRSCSNGFALAPSSPSSRGPPSCSWPSDVCERRIVSRLPDERSPRVTCSRTRPSPKASRTLDQLILRNYSWASAIPRNSRVAVQPDEVPRFFGFPWIYQLYGSDFRNEVLAIPHRDATPERLLPTLRRRGVEYLVTYPGTETDRIARAAPRSSNRSAVATASNSSA